MGQNAIVGIRIDIDAVRDVETVPDLLAMLRNHDLQATFFVAMGPDKAGRNIFRYLLNPRGLIRASPFRRYGIKNLFLGLFGPPPEIHANKGILRGIIKEGHEVGLHGYDHYLWVNHLHDMAEEEIMLTMQKGIKLFRQVFKNEPKSFSSPGFRTSQRFIRVLDDFNFRYSSDFIANAPFYPSINNKTAKTLQVPVTIGSLEDLATGVGSDAEVIAFIKGKIKTGFCTFYIHPSYEVVFKKKLLNQVLEEITADEHCTNMTFSQIAKEWKNRNEDTADI